MVFSFPVVSEQAQGLPKDTEFGRQAEKGRLTRITVIVVAGFL
jgi:hypothetical protein